MKMKKSILICALLASMCVAQLRSDLNGDGYVDFKDFAIFSSEWNMSDPNEVKYVVAPAAGQTLVPNCAGDYYYAGLSEVDNNRPMHLRTDGLFKLVDGEAYNLIKIVSGESVWLNYDDGLEGEYCAQYHSSGRATVTAVSCSQRIYRGQDGVIDYNNVVGRMWPDDTSVSLANQNLPPNTMWDFVRRQVSECGLESADSPACKVIINSDGSMISNTPNTPANVIIEQVIGGKLRLRWRYFPTGQEILPTGFAIYVDDGSGFDFSVPLAVVPYKRAIEHSWTSDALTHGERYKFIVRSYAGSLASYIVSGDLTPDAAGDYYPAGTYNDQPCEKKLNSEFYRWFFAHTNHWLISQVLGNAGNYYWFHAEGTGIFTAAGLAAGTATVVAPAAQPAHSINTDYVSAVADAVGPTEIAGASISWEVV